MQRLGGSARNTTTSHGPACLLGTFRASLRTTNRGIWVLTCGSRASGDYLPMPWQKYSGPCENSRKPCPNGASWWRRDVCRTHSGSRAGVWLLQQPRNEKGFRSEGSSRKHADVLCDVSVLDIIFSINVKEHFLILSSKFAGAHSDFFLTLVS